MICCLSPPVAVSPSETQEQHALRAPERRGRVSGLGSLCGLRLRPVTFQPPPHTLPAHTSQWLAMFLDSTSGQICFLEVSAYFSRFHECGDRQGWPHLPESGREVAEEAQVKGVLMPKRGLVRASPAFLHGITILLNKKIGIHILTNRNALRIFKIKTGKFCCICQNPRQSR